jgi:hypothetical protein
MIVFANGDNHTVASNPNETKFYNYDIAWPRWIAENLQADYINIAEPGSGNEQISRSTIIKVASLIKNVDPKELLVTILWNGWKRYEFWSNDEEKHQSYGLKFSWKPKKEILEYVEKRTSLESDNYIYYKDLFHIYTTAVALESYGVKYIFCNANKCMLKPEEFIDSSKLKNEYEELYNLYGDRKNTHIGFHNKEETFQGYLKDIPTVAAGRYWGVDGHKAYAKFVQKRLDFNQIVPYNRC